MVKHRQLSSNDESINAFKSYVKPGNLVLYDYSSGKISFFERVGNNSMPELFIHPSKSPDCLKAFEQEWTRHKEEFIDPIREYAANKGLAMISLDCHEISATWCYWFARAEKKVQAIAS